MTGQTNRRNKKPRPAKTLKPSTQPTAAQTDRFTTKDKPNPTHTSDPTNARNPSDNKTNSNCNCNSNHGDDDENDYLNPMQNPMPREELFPLLSATSIPELWRRPYILDGYRLYYSFDRCFQSLFRMHNETGNCWTHLAGLGLFTVLNLFALVRVMWTGSQGSGTQHYMVILYLGGVQLCMSFSVLFHLLNCHSYHAFFRFLKLDMCGISAQICASFFPAIYLGFYCYTHWVWTYLVGICVFALAGVLAAYLDFMHRPENERYRQMVYISMVLSGLIPSAHWLWLAPAQERDMFLGYVIGMFALYGLGLFFYLTAFPECWIPGRFDIWFHSHQWWHVCIVGAAYVWYLGCARYAEFIATKECPSDLVSVEF